KHPRGRGRASTASRHQGASAAENKITARPTHAGVLRRRAAHGHLRPPDEIELQQQRAATAPTFRHFIRQLPLQRALTSRRFALHWSQYTRGDYLWPGSGPAHQKAVLVKSGPASSIRAYRSKAR